MPPPPLKTVVPQTTDAQAIRQAIVGIREDLTRLNLGVANPTTGAPTDTPAAGTIRFDKATDTLWAYNGTSWVSTVLT